ncbi:type II toxin-antitoxin system RelE/ParE family toxin [Alkalimarinus coralli]|uniref:type II toxin-antitoxin system RelE/ParE family toxin n=1 Tax=Alkalimarinus coralli TaxID=2935863 RepID=UPI00202B5A40|nr:type II toxin-antitoxin system RelE/ParE family toxin [Alkalimarinus coralli]
MRLVYTKRALADIEIALEWYERQQKGLSGDFLDSLELTINSILDNPELYPVKYKKTRGALLRRFPYSAFYTVEAKNIVIHAVFHSRQAPGKNP